MQLIELPLLRAGDAVAVQLERTDCANTTFWVVTVRANGCSQPRRRWYAEEAAALAYAAEQADQHGLLLFDLREPEG